MNALKPPESEHIDHASYIVKPYNRKYVAKS